MFNDKIEPIIYNVVETIGDKDLFQKGWVYLAGPGLMSNFNCTQKIE